MKNTQSASWKWKSAHRQYADNTNRQKTAPRQYADKTGRTWKKSSKVVQMWIKKSDLNVLYVLSTNTAGPNKIWVPKR